MSCHPTRNTVLPILYPSCCRGLRKEINFFQDREAEPRFTGPPSSTRGGYDGPAGRGGGFAGGYAGAPPPGGARQIFINNVCIPIPISVYVQSVSINFALSSYPTLLAGKTSKTCSVKLVCIYLKLLRKT